MPSTKVKATLSFDGATWQAFREACLHRRVSASHLLNSFMAVQLATWKAEDTTTERPTTQAE